MATPDDFDENILNADSDGSQSAPTEPQQNQVTSSPLANRPITGVLTDLASENSRGLGNPIALNLTAAAFRQLERENAELKRRVEDLEARLDSSREELTSSKIELTKTQSVTRASHRVAAVASLLFLISPILIGMAYSDRQASSSNILIGLGAVLIISALVIQFWGRAK